MESKKSEEAFERYKLVVDALIKIKDKRGIKLIDELIRLAIRYIEIVNTAEIVGKLQKWRMEEQEFKEKISNLDNLRRRAHDALISQLKIVNRYLFLNKKLKNKILPGGIYSLDPNTLKHIDRIAVGDWVGYLTESLARRGIIKLTKRG